MRFVGMGIIFTLGTKTKCLKFIAVFTNSERGNVFKDMCLRSKVKFQCYPRRTMDKPDKCSDLKKKDNFFQI